MVHTFPDGRSGCRGQFDSPPRLSRLGSDELRALLAEIMHSPVRDYHSYLVSARHRYLVSALIPKWNIIHARSSHFLLLLESIYSAPTCICTRSSLVESNIATIMNHEVFSSSECNHEQATGFSLPKQPQRHKLPHSPHSSLINPTSTILFIGIRNATTLSPVLSLIHKYAASKTFLTIFMPFSGNLRCSLPSM